MRPSAFAEDARQLVARAREFERQGAAQEASVAYDMALALVDDAPAGPFHADLLRWKGTLLRELGETAQAEALYRRSLEVAQFIRYTRGVAHAQNCLAAICQRRGEMAQARQLYDDASLNAAAAGDQRLYAMIEQNLGSLATILGEMDDAHLRYRISLRAFREAGDEEGMMWVLNNIGLLHAERRRYGEAAKTFDQALALARAREDVYMEGLLELSRAEMLITSGQFDEATTACDRALAIADQRGDRLRRAEALKLRAIIERSHAELERAITSLEEARALAAEGEDVLLHGQVLRELGEVWRWRGERERAQAIWSEALGVFRKVGAAREIDALERRLTTMASASE